MSIHRTDRPNAPYRVRKSTLTGTWAWQQVTINGNYFGRFERGYPTREAALHAAAGHAATPRLTHREDRMRTLVGVFTTSPEALPVFSTTIREYELLLAWFRTGEAHTFTLTVIEHGHTTMAELTLSREFITAISSPQGDES